MTDQQITHVVSYHPASCFQSVITEGYSDMFKVNLYLVLTSV